MKLALGGAQFGLDYGINNGGGSIDKKKIFQILNSAHDKSVNLIDTAKEYGDSEKKIGEFIKERGEIFNIVSKSSSFSKEGVKRDLNQTLENLNINKIYGYLLHNFKNFIENPETFNELIKLKDQGKIKKIGFSVYYPREIEYLLEKNIKFDLIQLPFNIFDQRFSYLFPKLKEKGVEIHVRSVFLQGLMFKNYEDLDEQFGGIKDKIKKLNFISEKTSISLASLCINFASLNENIDKIIVGVDNINHLKENFKELETNEINEETHNKLIRLKENNENILLPFKWKKEGGKEKKKILAIIQARMGSTRFPGKMLKEINNKPLVEYIINATKKSELIDEIVLATTNKEEDKILLEKVEKYGLSSFGGSEDNVLNRFYQVAKEKKADVIVRLTGDCPLHDPKIIDKVIKKFLVEDADFVSNVHPPTYPDGLDVEVFSFDVLEKAEKNASKSLEKEHVTPYIWKNKHLFKIANVNNDLDFSDLRWTVDEKEDLEFVKEIIKKLGKNKINMENVLETLKNYPEIKRINQKYQRNEGFKNSINQEDLKKFEKSTKLLKKAIEILPSVAQTYSKSYKYFCESIAPVFLEKGEKGHVWDIDGNEYIDFVCALGPVIIGYNNQEVNLAIIKQLGKGISFTLPTDLEVKLAKKLIEFIPCAESVKFVKNGSDATTASVRLARAYTGREIIACSGYHGYHDWYVGTTENDKGVPKSVKKLTKTFEYNNLDSLKKIFGEGQGNVAGVILEPLQGNGPEENFLENVKELCEKNNAVLIFDEVVSGFRIRKGGAQEYYKVTPHLTCVGKGIANGASVSAVVGKKEIMKLIDDGVFISTTFGGEAISLAAALKTIEILERPGSIEKIWYLGHLWKNAVEILIKEKNLENVIEMIGLPPHCGVIFKPQEGFEKFDLLSVYQQTLLDNSILSLGINNFCLEHTEEDIKKFIDATNKALEKVKEAIDKKGVEKILRGKKVRPIFKR